MKKSIKIVGMLFMVAVMVVSCSKDNDPTDDNLFVGTYNGGVSYTDTDSNTDKSTDDGRVTLVKVGDSYNFDFSDGIPSLKGIKMEKNENLFVSDDGAIKIDESSLTIGYSQGAKTWGASCTR